MPKLNFSVFTDKVASGEKTQTIRLWDQPSIKALKVGDRVNLWWTKRGLKKGLYCRFCARANIFIQPEDVTGKVIAGASQPFGAVYRCPNCRYKITDVGLRCVLPESAPFIVLPRLLGAGIITSKSKIALFRHEKDGSNDQLFTFPEPDNLPRELALKLNIIPELAKADGFENVKDFFDFFDAHYGIDKKLVEFAVIRWGLVK